ncbi:helix-hairpin-helix domain-containing protein [Geobacter pelophilus]|uniref:Helix-hairpin-helix domain-containing protein n=1 Tax=Geoanaerobacter pelophilus TaxID=60036 RepID=A0AAW4L9G2_9BACT|nr:helix-hairpin-helix domain-containing protein [Geoanaerobacter pelophilus]MBT0666215.1 helix-hairpin-helix domain-containing protein [Geoanaerobacter pelophilus]
MSNTLKELQQIKGIGEILAMRLCEAGIDSFAAITKAGESGLKAIKGINPRAIQSILAQAGALAKNAAADKSERVALIKERSLALRTAIQNIAESARQRLAEQLQGKPGQKLALTLVRLVDTLDKVEGVAHKRLKRAGKALTKAERRLEVLTDAGHKDLRKGLKKARKSLRRALA